MNLESRKYKFIEKLMKVEEEDVIYKLEAILENSSDNKIWDEIPSHIKQAIDISIEQSERGQVRPHNEVMFDIKKKYNIV